jgi:hypothetical protein
MTAQSETTRESRAALDPSPRTVDALHREVMWEDKLRDKEIAHLKELFSEATGARDRAIALLQAFADKSPTTAEVAQAVASLEALMVEKFKSVEGQFTERDKRVEQTAKDSKTAVDAALQAAKEAVNKTEVGFGNSIVEAQKLIAQNTKNTDDKINDLKDRVTASEARGKGMGESWGYLMGLIMAGIAIAALVVMVLKK